VFLLQGKEDVGIEIEREGENGNIPVQVVRMSKKLINEFDYDCPRLGLTRARRVVGGA
jgi:hypothetical protein